MASRDFDDESSVRSEASSRSMRREAALKDGKFDLSKREVTFDAELLSKLLSLDSLSHLKLNAVQLRNLPDDLFLLSNLTRLDLYENQLTSLSPQISKLGNLKHLDVAHNQIKALPDEIMRLTQLELLNVKDNQLENLPQLNLLTSLTKLKVSQNNLDLARLPPGLAGILVSFGSQRVPSLIEPRLYLSSYIAAQNLSALQQLGITHILTLSKDAPPKFPELFTYKIIPVDDLVTVDLSPYWDEIVDFITANMETGCVLVHCKQGVSRSASAVMAYLIRKRHKTFDQALDWVRTARQCVNPNFGFRQQLLNLATTVSAPPSPAAVTEQTTDESSVKEKKEKKTKKEKKDNGSTIKKERSGRRSRSSSAIRDVANPLPPATVPEADVAALVVSPAHLDPPPPAPESVATASRAVPVISVTQASSDEQAKLQTESDSVRQRLEAELKASRAEQERLRQKLQELEQILKQYETQRSSAAQQQPNRDSDTTPLLATNGRRTRRKSCDMCDFCSIC